MVSPFDLSRTLPVGGGLLVLYSLSGPPVIKLHANGYYGAWPRWVVSISVLPLTGPPSPPSQGFYPPILPASIQAAFGLLFLVMSWIGWKPFSFLDQFSQSLRDSLSNLEGSTPSLVKSQDRSLVLSNLNYRERVSISFLVHKMRSLD